MTRRIKMNFDVDGYIGALMDKAKKGLLRDGEVSPKVIIITEGRTMLIDPFDFSDREASKQIIRSAIDMYNGQMVVLIYDSWVGSDPNTFPCFDADRRDALCVYGETKTESMIMLQEYKINGSGSVVFGEFSKTKNKSYGIFSGFFNP
jgi:hypothetical protein